MRFDSKDGGKSASGDDRNSLVRPLAEGPVDIIGDVHGEIDVLAELFSRLGYAADGAHPEGRRLVFLGDLVDRGPDSPGVVRWVARLIDAGRAECVLGNHDFNLMLGHQKQGNLWFFGQAEAIGGGRRPTPAVLADAATRREVLTFFSKLPLVLHRPGLRIVHACWHADMVQLAACESDVASFYRRYERSIDQRLAIDTSQDAVDRALQHQNLNPVKMLTSGPEERADQPYHSGGRLRHERRVPWWHCYREQALCVFGHYATLRDSPNGHGRAVCLDFAIGKRYLDRRAGDEPPETHLAALRLPEEVICFEDGQQWPLARIAGA